MNGLLVRAGCWFTIAVVWMCIDGRNVLYAADLMDVYALAKKNDPTFQSARFSYQAVQQKRPEALSALLPTISANGTFGYTDGKTKYTNTPTVKRNFKSNSWALQLTQPVFRADKLLAYDEARSQVKQALAQYNGALQDLMVRVAQAYFDIVVSSHGVTAAEAQVKALREQLSAAKKRFENGVASVTDKDEAQSRAASAEAQRVAAVNDLEAKRAALEAMIGQVPKELEVMSDQAILPRPTPDNVTLWVQHASAQNPSVLAEKAALEVSKYQVDRSRAQRLPTLDLVGKYGRNYSSGNIVNPVNYSTKVRNSEVSVQLNMPLIDGGGMNAQIDEATAKYQKVQADLRAAQRKSALKAHQAYVAILSDLSQAQALQAAVTAGLDAVKGNRLGYGLGIRINSDVLNSEQQLYTSKRDLEKARYDALLQGLKLKAAAGDLTEGDLKAVSNLLQSKSQDDSDKP